MSELKVLIAEDHPLMQEGIKRVLEKAPEVVVVGQAFQGAEVFAVAEKVKPDIVLLDLHMPNMDVVSLIRRIRKELPETKILMLSITDDYQEVRAALRAGAHGYLLKTISAENLVKALRQVVEGLNVLSPELTPKLIDPPDAAIPSWKRLTPREREIWKLLAFGASNGEIAARTFVTESTVKFHVRNLLRKLEVHNRAQAVALAYSEGLLDPRESGAGKES